MDKLLSRLFDYQKFENNEKLKAVIDDCTNRSGIELSDDELELLAAAGEIKPDDMKRKQSSET